MIRSLVSTLLLIVLSLVSLTSLNAQTASPLPPPMASGPGVYLPDLSILCCIEVPDLDELQGCPPHGWAVEGTDDALLYELKAKYHPPKAYRYPALDSFYIATPDKDRWREGDSVVLIAYVTVVKQAGEEKCNCSDESDKAEDDMLDTRFYLTQGPDSRLHVVGEVTPRIKALWSLLGIDYSTKALHDAYEGHWVRISGLLFYDTAKDGWSRNLGKTSYKNNPRATSWELHPVFSVELWEQPSD